jgi:hypothetical protein
MDRKRTVTREELLLTTLLVLATFVLVLWV